MNRSERLALILEIFNNGAYIIKKNEQLLSDSWRKSTVDYVIYEEKENDLEKADEDQENTLLPLDKKKILVPFGIIQKGYSNSMDVMNVTYAKRIVTRVVQDSAFWFGLVVDEDLSLYISDEKPIGKFSWKKPSLDELKEYVTDIRKRKLNTEEFRTAFESTLNAVKSSTQNEALIIDILKHLTPTIEFIQFGRTVTTYKDTQFQIIRDILSHLDSKKTNEFCRYTSSNSLHRIIKDNKESMCGLAVMNDKSEGFFLDQCISPVTSSNIWTRPQQEINEYNNAFITSLCSQNKSDDLTMWRLYGGKDGDGVCLIYEIDDDMVISSPNFIFLPISYGGKNNPIIQLFKLIKRLPLIYSFQFVLSYRNIFRYFVKPEQFKVEEEFRLLLIRDNKIKSKLDDPKWIFNSTYNIFHPIQELESSSSNKENKLKSPLKLKSIILGPKCTEAKVNKVQLRCWLNQLGLNNVEVRESDIDFYR